MAKLTELTTGRTSRKDTRRAMEINGMAEQSQHYPLNGFN